MLLEVGSVDIVEFVDLELVPCNWRLGDCFLINLAKQSIRAYIDGWPEPRHEGEWPTMTRLKETNFFITCQRSL